MRMGRIFPIAAATLLLAACDGDPTGESDNPRPTVSSVSPSTIPAGSSGASLVVAGDDFTGESRILWNDDEQATTYISARELRAQIDGSQLAATGSATVRVVTPAPGGGTSASFTITIAAPEPGPVVSVEIDVDSLTLAEGTLVQLAATARDSAGTIVTGRAVQWSSSDSEVGYVGALGEVTGIRPGTVSITARVDGTTMSVPVRVTADYPYELVFTGWGGSFTQPRLFRVDLSDSTGTAVTLGMEGPAGDPTPSPDGARIAYVGRTDAGANAILVAGWNGENPVTLLNTGDETCGQLSWSPDGEQLAFACAFGGDDLDIWLMSGTDGSGLTNLTDSHPGNQQLPAWSPVLADGSVRIAYAQYVAGEPQIWTMAGDGTDPRQLTSGLDTQPAWSPDGTTIAFQRTSVVSADIWLVDADGSNERLLFGANRAGPQSAPAWSPDGRLIAFSSTHETYGSGLANTSQVYTVWADGSGKIARRTVDEVDKFSPAWRAH